MNPTNNSGPISPTPTQADTALSQKKLSFRFNPGMFKSKKLYAIIGGVLLLLLAVIAGISFFAYAPEDVRISNVTDRSATISWVTEDKSEGYVLVSENGFLLPVRIGTMGSEKHYDDRDVSRAELKAAEKYAEEVKNNAEGGSVTPVETSEIEVAQVGEYFVHHVTVTGLDPQKDYQFMVGNGTFFVKAKDIDNSSTEFTTYAQSEDILVPEPAYGAVKEASFAKEAITDGVIYLRIADDSSGKKSTLISSPLAENGSWYIDLTGARDSENTAELFVGEINLDSESVYHDITIEVGPAGNHPAKVGLQKDAPADTFFISIPEDEEKASLFVNSAYAATWSVTCPDGTSFSESNATVHSTFNAIAQQRGDGKTGEQNWMAEACVGHQSSNSGGGGGGNSNPSGATSSGGKWEVSCNGKSYCENNPSVQGSFNNSGASSNTPGYVLWGQQACASGAPSTVCTTQTTPQEPPSNGGGSGGSGGSGGGAICGTLALKDEGDKCDLGATCQLTPTDPPNPQWPNAGGCDGDGPLICQAYAGAPQGEGKCVDPNATGGEDEGGSGGGGTGVTPGDDCPDLTGNAGPASDYICGSDGKWYYDVTKSSRYEKESANCPSADLFPCLHTCDDGSTVSCNPGESCAAACDSEVNSDSPNSGQACTNYGTTSNGLYCYSQSRIWIPIVVNLGTCTESACYCTKSSEVIGRNSRCEESGSNGGVTINYCDSSGVCDIDEVCNIQESLCSCGTGGGTVSTGETCTRAIFHISDVVQGPAVAPACTSERLNHPCGMDTGAIGICEAEFENINGTVVASYVCQESTDEEVAALPQIELNTVCAPEDQNFDSCRCNNGTWLHTDSTIARGGYCFRSGCGISPENEGDVCENSSGDKTCQFPEGGVGLISCRDVPYTASANSIHATATRRTDVLGATAGFYFDSEKGLVFTESGRYCTEYENSKVCFDVVNQGNKVLFIDSNSDGILNNGETDLSNQIQEIGLEREESLFSIPINSGFNLISFPGYFENIGDTASDFLAYVNDAYNDSVYSIAKFESGRWVVVGNRDGEPYGDQDFQLVPGQGYLIRAKSSFQLNITGFDFTDPVPTVLKPGWNLVAVHGSQTQYTAESLLDSLNSNEGFVSNNVTRWDTARGRYDGLQKEKDESDMYQVYGFDFPISKVQGYFVRVEEGEVTWSPE